MLMQATFLLSPGAWGGHTPLRLRPCPSSWEQEKVGVFFFFILSHSAEPTKKKIE